jgi:hypothetical protein
MRVPTAATVSSLLVVAGLAAPPAARAQATPAPALALPGSPPQVPAQVPAQVPPQVPPRPLWYGRETLVADGVAAALLTTAVVLILRDPDTAEARVWGNVGNRAALLGVAAGAYALGPPIIHATHGGWKQATIDLALRVGAPLLCGYGGNRLAVLAQYGGIHGRLDRTYLEVGGAIGAGMGYVAAVVVSAAALAYEDAPPAVATPGSRWTPTAGVDAQGAASAGIAGTF